MARVECCVVGVELFDMFRERVCELVSDESPTVRENAVDALGLMAERVPTVILQTGVFVPTYELVLQSLADEPRVAVRACACLSQFSTTAAEDERSVDDVEDGSPSGTMGTASNLLSPVFSQACQAVWATSNRIDSNEANLCVYACTLLCDLIASAAHDCVDHLSSLLTLLLAQFDPSDEANFRKALEQKSILLYSMSELVIGLGRDAVKNAEQSLVEIFATGLTVSLADQRIDTTDDLVLAIQPLIEHLGPRTDDFSDVFISYGVPFL